MARLQSSDAARGIPTTIMRIRVTAQAMASNVCAFVAKKCTLIDPVLP